MHFPTPFTPIESTRIIIRLVAPDDLYALSAINSDDAVTRYLPYPSWRNAIDGQEWLDRTARRYVAGEAFQFVMVERSSSAVVGTCLLFNFDPQGHRAEVGYVLGQAHWAQGLMGEAIASLVEFAFTTLRLQRLTALLDPRNAPSARLLERAGFTREGFFRRHGVCKGEVIDVACYGLLREDTKATTDCVTDAA